MRDTTSTANDATAATLRAVLDATLDNLGTDELRVLAFIATRLRMGAGQYGVLDLATDRRDWRKERDEEVADLLVYAACEALTSALPLARPPR